MKKFSIIIPTYNRQALLKELLNSMLIQKFHPENFEIIVVDNNSDYDVNKLVQNFISTYPQFDIKYILEPHQGEQYAWNTGIKNAQGKLLIFVDDDTTFHQDYFATLEKGFADKLDNIAGGGKVAPVFEYQKPAWINKFVMPYFAEINLGEKSKFPKNKFPYATNMLISKNVLEKVGLFNTELMAGKKHIPPGTFERDLFRRIRAAGYPVYYFHDLVVWHFIPQEKINKAYVKAKAIESGYTLRDIYRHKSFWWSLYAFWRDVAKWLAAFILSIYYIFTTQWEKAVMLFKLRWWKSKGFWHLGKEAQ